MKNDSRFPAFFGLKNTISPEHQKIINRLQEIFAEGLNYENKYFLGTSHELFVPRKGLRLITYIRGDRKYQESHYRPKYKNYIVDEVFSTKGSLSKMRFMVSETNMLGDENFGLPLEVVLFSKRNHLNKLEGVYWRFKNVEDMVEVGITNDENYEIKSPDDPYIFIHHDFL